MLVRWWSPLPPTPGVLAAQSALEIGALAGVAPEGSTWQAVVGARPKEAATPGGVPVTKARNLRPAASLDDRVLDVYHLGRDERTYAFLLPALFERPGVVVLHDDLSVDDFAPGRLGALAVEAALGVIARSERLADVVAERWPTRPVVTLPYWLPFVPELAGDGVDRCGRSQEEEARVGDGGRPGSQRPLVVGIVGCLDGEAAAVATEALLALPDDLRHRVRLRLSGTIAPPGSVESLRARLAAEGCTDALEVAPRAIGAELVHAVRTSDLVLSFPRWEGCGAGPAATWAREFGVPALVPDNAIGAGEEDLLWPLPAGPRALQVDTVVDRLERVLEARAAGARHRLVGRRDPGSWAARSALVARRFTEALSELSGAEAREGVPAGCPRRALPATLRRSRLLRIRAVGNFTTANGLAEAARRLTEAIEAAGIEVQREDVRVSPGPIETSHGLPGLAASLDCDVTLCLYNVHEMIRLPDEVLRPSGRPTYVAASWAWELPSLASSFRSSVERVDEVWAVSRYVAEAFTGLVGGPVRIVPNPVIESETPLPPRRSLGLPDDGLVYFFHFDCMSTFARKNPHAVVAAFRQAFGVDGLAAGPPRAHLVIKARHLRSFDSYAVEAAKLERAVRAVDGILIDEDLTAEETSWLVRSCDVYVSLHRSEGFGLGLAEAMLAAKPVVATGYSGNLDYMTGDTSCLVGFRLREIVPEELASNPGMEDVYEPGQLWAEPDVWQAAGILRRLHQNPDLRRRLGERARRAIGRLCSPARVGAVAAQALEEAAARAGRRTQPH